MPANRVCFVLEAEVPPSTVSAEGAVCLAPKARGLTGKFGFLVCEMQYLEKKACRARTARLNRGRAVCYQVFRSAIYMQFCLLFLAALFAIVVTEQIPLSPLLCS